MLFCGGCVLIAGCDATTQLLGTRTVHGVELVCHGSCLVFAATDYAWSLGVVLTQSGKCFGVAWIERRGDFKFGFHALGKAICLDERDAVGFLAQ